MIKIVVDSTGYLDDQFVKENDIGIVPIKVLIGDIDYKENENLSVSDFYKLLAETTVLPKTSQPSVQDFIDVYSPALEKGDSIISIHISEKVSGTINTARMAINALKSNAIKIIDSKSTIFSIRYLAEHTVKLIKDSLDFESAFKSTEKLVERFHDRFILNDLKYLTASGRLSKAEGLIGGLLNIKPILSFTDGAIKVNGVTRTWKKAKESLIKFIEKTKNTYGIEKLAVMYGNNLEEAKEFARDIKQAIKFEIDLIEAGVAIGNYAGPQWLGVGIQASS
ncbi:MAG: DegV family protein [Caldiserica bacterium]|nr:DegV family protein [Caldisericota bacterium]